LTQNYWLALIFKTYRWQTGLWQRIDIVAFFVWLLRGLRCGFLIKKYLFLVVH